MFDIKKTLVKTGKNIVITGSSLLTAGALYLANNPEVLQQATAMTKGTKYGFAIIALSAIVTAYADYKKHK